MIHNILCHESDFATKKKLKFKHRIWARKKNYILNE